MKTVLFSSLLACLLTSALAEAGTTQVQRQNQFMNTQRVTERTMTQTGYQSRSSVSNAQGQSLSRAVDVSGDRYNRSKTVTATNAEGQTAMRQSQLTRSPEEGTRSREMSGTTFDGKSYSGQSQTTRTDDGYTLSSSVTGPNGATTSREVDMSVNKASQTLTKTVAVTHPDGEVSTTTIVRSRDQGGE